MINAALMLAVMPVAFNSAPAPATIAMAMAPERYSICNGASVPSGYAIIAQDNFIIGCGNTVPRGWVIALPGDGISICLYSPVPRGYVYVAQDNYVLCGQSSGQGGWAIRRASDASIVCAASPIPSGYRRGDPASEQTCPGFGTNAWILLRR